MMLTNAAEIKFSNDVQVAEELVLLGDIAEVTSILQGEAEQLRRVVLFPNPQLSDGKIVSATEIRDILSRLGIKPHKHTFSGAQKISITNKNIKNNQIIQAASNQIQTTNQTIYQNNHQNNHQNIQQNNLTTHNLTPRITTTKPTANSVNLKNISTQFIDEMEKQISEAIRIHLTRQLSAKSLTATQIQEPSITWKVIIKLTREQTFLLATSGQISKIEGSEEPLVGRQKFDIVLEKIDAATGQNVVVPVEANVIPLTSAVVLLRSVPKGYIIRESDVAIDKIEINNTNQRNNNNEEYFIDINAVIGKETTTALRERSLITQTQIKRPTLVRKGEVVTLLAKNSGVIIRTVGIAKSDGAEGDTIFVTRINQDNNNTKRRNQKTQQPDIITIVTAPKTVEINATPIISTTNTTIKR
jgi:flagella basal body P-ring formation protein FlgA